MGKFDPEKLYVEYRQVTPTEPILTRHYTLTHSDITADLFLTIGLEYAYDKTNIMRDEVLAKWLTYDGNPFLQGYVYVDGQFGTVMSDIRNLIFRRELPMALEAIRYGDRKFFLEHPELDYAPIWIFFDSINPQYKQYEYWGTPQDYKYSNNRTT